LAARYPSAVQGSFTASALGISLAAVEPMYLGVMIDRGSSEFRWSGTQNESTPVAAAAKKFARVMAIEPRPV